MTEWRIKGEEMVNCNCNFGCPCQFGVLPTHGNCEAVLVYDIAEGHYGEIDLGGLRAASVYQWPGPIHEGNGQMQLIVDERATPEQRAALEAIMTGQDTEEMATMWFVYGAMSPTKHPTLTARIELDWDAAERNGKASVGGVFDIEIRPIPNIVTGKPHRVGIQLPHGFEFRHAEAASGTSKTTGGAIEMSFDATHAHFAKLHLTGQGVVA